ncbi:MAG: Ig-like domain-containing protein [Ruminococcus sp.]|uniref:glycoside hydrolase family protein n=1 Tax=Ruminococcus sp. TaxID=41978 RepID=UPI00287303F2|nr:Ig-like domain-containing protein [Ruminococcus sp.]MBQ3284098.1 Ig-like domain-containing protein [Ruminococcus sp.]
MKRAIDCIVALTLVVALLVSIFLFSYPAASAAESDGAEVGYDCEDELMDIGYTHRGVSFDSIPDPYDPEIRTGITELYLNKTAVYLDINERFQLNLLDAYSHTVNVRADFSVSNGAVANVSASGVITALKSGSTTVIVSDRVTESTLTCTVYVGDAYAPTQPPAPKPTDEPTDPPEPTQAPTQKPTQAPTQPPTQKPTQPATTAPQPTQASTETLSLKETSATVYKGNYYHVVATSNTTVSFKSSNTSVATVNSKGIVTALATGTVTITASTSTKSATCKLTVKSGSSVNLSHTEAKVDRFMTFMLNSTTSGVKWSSSDPSVASVYNEESYGLVKGEKAGTAVITVSTSSGAATCLMTVESSYPVQFAYTTPNCAAKNQTVTLVCITDTMRTGVRFAVDMGSETRYVNATSKVKDGSTYVWKGTTSFSSAGTYNVKAYSQFNNGTSWHSCADGETTAFVADSTDMTTTVCAKRRASDALINLIATFEGYFSSVYIDSFTGDPTLGYGVLVFTGEKFYNNLTKDQAYAYLVQNVNNAGYSKDVNTFLLNKNIKFNQQQYDALVCFTYNCGTGPLFSDDELIAALCNCYKNGTRDFNYINKQDFIDKLCQYHHAGGSCVYGLLYRRVDETEMFFYGDYEADYGHYKYPIRFKCAYDSSFNTY